MFVDRAEVRPEVKGDGALVNVNNDESKRGVVMSQYCISLINTVNKIGLKKGIEYRDWNDFHKNMSPADIVAFKTHLNNMGYKVMRWGDNVVVLCDGSNHLQHPL